MCSTSRAELLVGAVLVTTVLTTLAACTSQQPGQATTAAGVSPGYRAPTNGAAGISLPPRPNDVSLTGVDPCALLTAAQRGRFGVRAGVKGLPAQLADDSPTCDYRFADNTPGAEYGVTVDTVEGIQLYLDPARSDHIRPVSVGGFPALDITLTPPDLLQGCTTAVSVATGQMFMVNLGQPARGTTTAQSCARTEQVAGAVLATAKTLK
jgi:hypothetical protein